MTQLPTWLLEARGTVSESSQGTGEERPDEIIAGDVCLLEPAYPVGRDVVRRPVVVLDSPDPATALVALATPEIELATDCDPILEPEQTALGYRLAVFTRFTATVWSPQLRRRLGALDQRTFDQVESLVWNPEGGTSLPTGLPLGERHLDGRWPTLEAEADWLEGQATAGQDTRRGLYTERPLVDPCAFQANDWIATLASSPGGACYLERLATGDLEVPGSLLMALDRCDLLGERSALVILSKSLNRALSSEPDVEAVKRVTTLLMEDMETEDCLRASVLAAVDARVRVHRVAAVAKPPTRSRVCLVGGDPFVLLYECENERPSALLDRQVLCD